MSISTATMTWEALAAAIEAAGTYSTISEAVQAGVIIIEDASAVGGLVALEGGAGTAVISASASALEVAQAASLAGSAATASTGAVTLVKTGTGFKLAGMASMSLPAVAAAAAPLAGVTLGANLYLDNPELWTKISSTLLPFCYAENKIQAFVDFVKDPLTSEYSPIVTIPTAIVNALKSLFDKEVRTYKLVKETDSLGRTVSGRSVAVDDIYSDGPAGEEVISITGSPVAYGYIGTPGGFVLKGGSFRTRSKTGYEYTYATGADGPAAVLFAPSNPYTARVVSDILNDPGISPQYWPPTAGVSAPTVPVEPIVWPDTPIIVVPDPLGPDYQPIPVTPIVPMLPPYEPPLPLPEHVPDPTPEEAPEEWPEEEPWPSISPFPVPDPSTEPWPSPDWPEVMPWPLPEENPSEWPTQPDDWPTEFPDELPWPAHPTQWPEEVPWPETPPDDWPDDVPWPDNPDDWPEEIPWPVPWPKEWPTYPPTWPEEFPPELPWPDNPDDWPVEVPWPDTAPDWWPDGTPWPDDPEDWPDTIPWPKPPVWPIPWPDEIPYPWPFPYPLPDPSPDPYPDPKDIPDPEQRVDPIIDPWPWPIPDPKTDPDPNPKDDPSQPEPRPEPEPDRPPVDPDPPPPSGTINPAPPPIIPLPFSSTTGLISVYHPTQSELLAFCNWLWVTWQDATIEKIWNNPFDGIITLFELYCTPTDVGRKNIRSGFLDSGVSSETISRYTEIDCGSIGVPEYFGNYLDYAPYSKCHIYLPFIGIIELNVDDIVGHGVNVTYRIDEYNGSCIAMITVAKSTSVNGTDVEYSNIMYQFSGNCAVDLPIAGGSQAAIKAGMLEAAAWGLGSVVGGIMSGSSPLSIGAGMAYGAASAVHSLVSAKSSVQHSGSFGASFGALGNKKPFIIVTRPKQIQVPNYQELYGYPAHKMVTIGDCTGYLRCREVHVISPTASDEEKTLIEQMLKEGVYITE